ncbi:hypothetical protein PPERSA_11657 [Pseudocohnilembus persalinus]|uniref:Uncharacterized protein n=1 Tax=Pseudocohnilembus persalinus TaxID=266149 RepID=A0A0V0QA61_PSEPJ|nr:hypothetical protein PPERSA_11657 [Pseudocohnilembus persalinus]|eukprot:KRW99056.1 hypothetical protein PPERSA_11657 [Pseudocohnilembus persalinus]
MFKANQKGNWEAIEKNKAIFNGIQFLDSSKIFNIVFNIRTQKLYIFDDNINSSITYYLDISVQNVYRFGAYFDDIQGMSAEIAELRVQNNQQKTLQTKLSEKSQELEKLLKKQNAASQNQQSLNDQVETLKETQKKSDKFILDLFSSKEKYEEVDDLLKNKEITFEASKFKENDKNIHISKDQKTINFSKTASSQKKINFQQVYTNLLQKNLTYHIKIKVNLNKKNKQSVEFALVEDKQKNKCFNIYSQNLVAISNNNGQYGASVLQRALFKGQYFSEFMQDNVTIFNVVFNFDKQFFYLYDDEGKSVIAYDVDKAKIQDLRFGIRFWDEQGQEATIQIESFVAY